MWKEVLDWTLWWFSQVGDFWTWLNTSMLFGSDWFKPITIIGGAGFLIIIGASVYRLFHI